MKPINPPEPEFSIDKLLEILQEDIQVKSEQEVEAYNKFIEVVNEIDSNSNAIHEAGLLGIWTLFGMFHNMTDERKIDLTLIFKNTPIPELIVQLYNTTYRVLKYINSNLFKVLRILKSSPEEIKKCNEEFQIDMSHNKYISKLSLDIFESERYFLYIGNVLLIKNFEIIKGQEPFLSYFKKRELEMKKMIGYLKTLLENSYSKIIIEDLKGRTSSFNTGENGIIKILSDTYINDVLPLYNDFRNMSIDLNKKMGLEAKSPAIDNFILELLAVDVMKYIKCSSITQLYNWNRALLKNEKEAKLFTHYLLWYIGMPGFIGRTDFEMSGEYESGYTKNRIREIEKYLIK